VADACLQGQIRSGKAGMSRLTRWTWSHAWWLMADAKYSRWTNLGIKRGHMYNGCSLRLFQAGASVAVAQMYEFVTIPFNVRCVLLYCLQACAQTVRRYGPWVWYGPPFCKRRRISDF
jgi:hypothetical protein